MSGTTGTFSVHSGRARPQPIGYGYIPAEGSRGLSAQYNWTAGQGSYTDDLTTVFQRGIETTIQSVFVDNSTVASSVSLTCPGTQQTVTCPALSQGIFPLFLQGGSFIVSSAASAGTTRMIFSNMPLGPSVTPPLQAYVGPGDIVAGATAFYGLRGYTAAGSAPGTLPAINVVRASDSAATDIVILATGRLDTATLAAFLTGTTGTVATWYDQSGNANHVTQATAANQPQIVLNALGPSLPTVSFVGAAVQKLSATLGASVAQPWTLSAVAAVTHSAVTDYIIAGGNTFAPRIQMQNTSGVGPAVYAGGTIISTTIPSTSGTYFALTGLANGAASIIAVNNQETSGNAGAGVFPTPLTLGSDGTNEHPLTGNLCEAGLWPIGMTATQRTLMAVNQRAYYQI